MAYMTIKEETKEKLRLGREPSWFSYSYIIAFMAFGYGAASYSEDAWLWRVLYMTGGVMVGLSCIEDWEECEFDKKTGEVRQTLYTVYDRILYPILQKDRIVVSNIEDIIDVAVEDQHIRYFGKSHQVLLILRNGIHLGVTNSFTRGDVQDHAAVAHKIRSFLDLKETPRGFLEDEKEKIDDESSSSEDEFEYISKEEFENEMIDNKTDDKKDDDDDDDGNSVMS